MRENINSSKKNGLKYTEVGLDPVKDRMHETIVANGLPQEIDSIIVQTEEVIRNQSQIHVIVVQEIDNCIEEEVAVVVAVAATAEMKINP